MHPLVGIDIGGTKVRLCTRLEDDVSCVQYETGAATSPETLSQRINAYIDALPKPPTVIGVAVPGLVDNGKVTVSDVLPGIAGWDPASSISAPCPVHTINDAEAALVEVSADLEPNATIAIVMAGTGIGAAMMSNGVILRGACGWAGELGASPIMDANVPKTLDDISGGEALLKALGGDPDRAHQLLANGDPAAHEAVERAGAALGCAIATLINLLNPSRLVLGGGALRFPGYAASAVQTARRFALPTLLQACEIDVPTDGDALVARGAVRYAQTQL